MWVGVAVPLAACDFATDAATRLAGDIQAGAARLGKDLGSSYRIEHVTPSAAGQCVGPYTVQLDKVGALIIWCKDGAARVVSSHSTSSHGRFVDVPQTFRLDKPAGATLVIDIERQAGGRAVVIDVR